MGKFDTVWSGYYILNQINDMKFMWEERKEDGVRQAAREGARVFFLYDRCYSYSYSYSTIDVTPTPPTPRNKEENSHSTDGDTTKNTRIIKRKINTATMMMMMMIMIMMTMMVDDGHSHKKHDDDDNNGWRHN